MMIYRIGGYYKKKKEWATCAALKCFHNGIILIVISIKL